MLSAFDLWILIPETRTLWVLIAENVRLTEVNFACTCGSLWFSDSAVCGERAVTQPRRHHASTTASPSTLCTRMEEDVGLAKGSKKRMPGVRAGEEGVSAVDPVPLWLPAHDCKASGGIRKCHPASTTTSRRHFIYQWAFFANYKRLFILIDRIKMSLLQQGTLGIGSRLFVLGLCASCIWEVVKKLHTPCYVLILKKPISDDRKAENKLWMLDEKLINIMNTWSCFFTRKK